MYKAIGIIDTAQKMKFSINGFLQYMWPNPQETVDSVTFTWEVFNGKLYFLCSVNNVSFIPLTWTKCFFARTVFSLKSAICDYNFYNWRLFKRSGVIVLDTVSWHTSYKMNVIPKTVFIFNFFWPRVISRYFYIKISVFCI